MNLFFIHRLTKDPEDEGGQHKLVPLHNNGYNTNEGSEFLDDAIRIEDVPEVYPEENITDGRS
jgi:hypothetical protein